MQILGPTVKPVECKRMDTQTDTHMDTTENITSSTNAGGVGTCFSVTGLIRYNSQQIEQLSVGPERKYLATK